MPREPHSEKSQPKGERKREQADGEAKPEVMDAIRHVGPTLEAEGIFVPTGELPENRIENEAVAGAGDIRDTTDEYDREAEAMGAEALRTRLPGDTSSDPHTDVEEERSGRRSRTRDKDHAA